MTIFRFEFFGGFLLFALLTYLFVRNLQRGRSTGEIYSRSLLVRRSESPINFWIAVVSYVTASLFTGIAAMGCLALAINADAVFSLLG
jgi:hypothetical protein